MEFSCLYIPQGHYFKYFVAMKYRMMIMSFFSDFEWKSTLKDFSYLQSQDR